MKSQLDRFWKAVRIPFVIGLLVFAVGFAWARSVESWGAIIIGVYTVMALIGVWGWMLAELAREYLGWNSRWRYLLILLGPALFIVWGVMG